MVTLTHIMLTTIVHYRAMSFDQDGDVPVYVQLADILRARIESGELARRRSVPSKRPLMQEYGIAGGTVDTVVAVLRGEAWSAPSSAAGSTSRRGRPSAESPHDVNLGPP